MLEVTVLLTFDTVAKTRQTFKESKIQGSTKMHHSNYLRHFVEIQHGPFSVSPSLLPAAAVMQDAGLGVTARNLAATRRQRGGTRTNGVGRGT